jgi:hypothetical protein
MMMVQVVFEGQILQHHAIFPRRYLPRTMSDYNSTEENNKDYSRTITEIISNIEQISKLNNDELGSISGKQKIKYFNLWADYWRYEVGVNVIPANTKDKNTYIKWRQWQNSPISEEQHEQWKEEGAFNNGMAIIAGKISHAKDITKRNSYLILIDLDNKKAIDEFCKIDGKQLTLEELSNMVIVEQHDDDPNKAHIIFYASHPFKKKSSDTTNKAIIEKLDKNKIPAIEIKGAGEHGILYVTPSQHKKGHFYRIKGTMILGAREWDAFETHCDNFLNNHGISYLTNNGNAVDGNNKQTIIGFIVQ